MDWKSVGVLGGLAIIVVMLFPQVFQPFQWESTDIIDKSRPGQPKYYYILVDFTVDAWKTDDGRILRVYLAYTFHLEMLSLY